MASPIQFLALILTLGNITNGFVAGGGERESDGASVSRDSPHYGPAGHNPEFDHEAILGSVKEAEEFDRLPPEESRKRLSLLLPKMDLNENMHIDRVELKMWILNSFRKISREEAEERMSDADDDKNGEVTWQEYLHDTFGVDSDDELGADDTGDTGMLVHEEKAMWAVADVDGNGALNFAEFEVFSNPEEHPVMHSFLLNQTMREKDKNNDGYIDFDEFLADRNEHQDREWYISEKEKFEHELDQDGDGTLDASEIQQWVIPDNDEIASEEVEHLFRSADEDGDAQLSYDEVLRHHDVFVGSEATGYGDDLRDEL